MGNCFTDQTTRVVCIVSYSRSPIGKPNKLITFQVVLILAIIKLVSKIAIIAKIAKIAKIAMI